MEKHCIIGDFEVAGRKTGDMCVDPTKTVYFNIHSGVLGVMGTCPDSGKVIKGFAHATEPTLVSMTALHQVLETRAEMIMPKVA